MARSIGLIGLVHRRLARQQVRGRSRVIGQPGAVSGFVQILLVVERDRLDEGHHPAVLDGHGDRAAQHAGGIVAACRDGEDQPGDVTQRPNAVVVVEVAAETLLVGETRQAHDHRIAELAGAEELQAGGLAANLVERVVDVGQVLDLGHRQKADVGGPLGDAQDRCLVEQRVEHPAGAESLLQAVGDVVDPALSPHVLAEQDQLRSSGQLIGQCGIQVAGQCPGVGIAGRLGERIGHGFAALIVGEERAGGALGHARGVVRRHRADHRFGGVQPRPAGGLLRGGQHPGARRAHQVAEVGRRSRAGLDQPAGVAQQRVTGLVLRDLCRAAVRVLRIAAGVAPQAYHGHVQEGRLARAAHVVHRLGGGVPHLVQLAGGQHVAQVRLGGEGLANPVVRGRHADAGAVVLADEQDRHGQADARGIARGVDGRQGSGVVRRGIAERAQHHRVGRQLAIDAQPPRPGQAEGQAHRLRQVAGNGGGLGRDPQRAAAPHLVPSLGDGLVAAGHDAKQRVEGWRHARQLAGARHHQRPGAVMQEGGIGGAKDRAQHGVVLVAGGADGVEGPIRLLQLAAGDVDRTRGDLVLEQLDRPAGGQAAALADGGVEFQGLGRIGGSGEVVVERVLDDGDAVEGHARRGMTSMWSGS